MFDQLIENIKKDKTNWREFQDLLIEREIASKTVLLHEGEIASQVFYIKKGCLREWFNKDGKDITFQFFLEGQAIASIESFISNQPSIYTIESIEPSTLFSLSKENFNQLQRLFPDFKDGFQEFMLACRFTKIPAHGASFW